MTFRFFISDILETFKQVFDDKEIQLNQVLYWTLVVANRLRKQHFDREDTGLFLTIFDKVTVSKDTALKDRPFIELPAAILDLDKEKAVKYITYNFETGQCCDGDVGRQSTDVG